MKPFVGEFAMLPDPFSLEQIEIASPCRAAWSEMEGNDSARFCRQCHKNVYNLSAMSRSEAETLVQEMEGVPCVRLYRRMDGTVLTDDCPVGMRRAKKAMYDTIARLSFVAMFAAMIGWPLHEDTNTISALRRIEPFATIINWLWPSPPPPPRVLMGSMSLIKK
jgi:hypothetical protein